MLFAFLPSYLILAARGAAAQRRRDEFSVLRAAC